MKFKIYVLVRKNNQYDVLGGAPHEEIIDEVIWIGEGPLSLGGYGNDGQFRQFRSHAYEDESADKLETFFASCNVGLRVVLLDYEIPLHCLEMMIVERETK